MVFHFPRGIIALDIDGTVTVTTHPIHPEVIKYLSSLYEEGWSLIFMTGRSFQWGFQELQPLTFPYGFAVQNGALILEMPSRRILDRRYLSIKILPDVETICREEKTDCVVYSGFENQDWCYFRPAHLSPELLSYLQQRSSILKEKWQAIPSFKDLTISLFASLKCFAKEEQAKRLSHRIEKELKLHAPMNRDPVNSEYFVIQVTHPEATKGFALHHFRQSLRLPGVIIAAGDDSNDLSMLQVADIRVVMNHAPAHIQAIADVLAPSVTENGIIEGLSQAIQMVYGSV